MNFEDTFELSEAEKNLGIELRHCHCGHPFARQAKSKTFGGPTERWCDICGFYMVGPVVHCKGSEEDYEILLERSKRFFETAIEWSI